MLQGPGTLKNKNKLFGPGKLINLEFISRVSNEQNIFKVYFYYDSNLSSSLHL